MAPTTTPRQSGSDFKSQGPSVAIPHCLLADCENEVDLFLGSSDGYPICAHEANLRAHAEGIYAKFKAVEDIEYQRGYYKPFPILDLPQTGETLMLLMEFVHQRQYPDISLLRGDAIIDLAEAAEEYKVYSAVFACLFCIRPSIQNYPIRALKYGLQYGYFDIADSAGPLTLHEPMDKMKTSLGGGRAYFAWLQYRCVYMSEFFKLLVPQKDSMCRCSEVPEVMTAVLRYLTNPKGDILDCFKAICAACHFGLRSGSVLHSKVADLPKTIPSVSSYFTELRGKQL